MKYNHILFHDIETAPKVPSFAMLDPHGQEAFKSRFKAKIQEHLKTFPSDGGANNLSLLLNGYLETLWQENAALMAEFLQIVSIGFGFFFPKPEDPNDYEFRVKAVVSKDEVYLLNEAKKIIENMVNKRSQFSEICGHNSDSFDNPILCRRMVINNIKIPYLLDPAGKKTWDIPWRDTMKLFGFSEWGYKISLDRLCYALGVPTPKSEMDGSMVKDLFYGATPGPEDLPFGIFDKEEVRFKSIGTYQCGDVVATANCFLRLNNEPIIPEHKIKYA